MERTSRPRRRRLRPIAFFAANAGLPSADWLAQLHRRKLPPRASSASSSSTASATPVTVRKSESAMLPFLQDKITARKLLIYSDQSSAHPLNAAEITNSTGKTLDGGPITVFDAGTYGGEALMETVKTGDKRLISYAVDLGTRITTQFDSKGDIVREIHFRRGVLTTRTAAVETRTYTIRNVDQKPKTLIIEHPARPEYTLLERKPTEKTANAYRFEVKLAAGATEKFPVIEERVYDNSFAVTNLTPDVLFTYVQNKNLSDTARKQLGEIVNRKQQIADADAEVHRVEAQVGDHRARPGAHPPEHQQPEPCERPAGTGAEIRAPVGRPGGAAGRAARSPIGARAQARRVTIGAEFTDRENGLLKLALIGYGNVGRAFAALIRRKQSEFPFEITGIHTARHGTAVDPRGLAAEPHFGPAAASVEAFLASAAADVAVELTTLNPVTGQPAIDHIRAAFARGMHCGHRQQRPHRTRLRGLARGGRAPQTACSVSRPR